MEQFKKYLVFKWLTFFASVLTLTPVSSMQTPSNSGTFLSFPMFITWVCSFSANPVPIVTSISISSTSLIGHWSPWYWQSRAGWNYKICSYILIIDNKCVRYRSIILWLLSSIFFCRSIFYCHLLPMANEYVQIYIKCFLIKKN